MAGTLSRGAQEEPEELGQCERRLQQHGLPPHSDRERPRLRVRGSRAACTIEVGRPETTDSFRGFSVTRPPPGSTRYSGPNSVCKTNRVPLRRSSCSAISSFSDFCRAMLKLVPLAPLFAATGYTARCQAPIYVPSSWWSGRDLNPRRALVTVTPPQPDPRPESVKTETPPYGPGVFVFKFLPAISSASPRVIPRPAVGGTFHSFRVPALQSVSRQAGQLFTVGSFLGFFDFVASFNIVRRSSQVGAALRPLTLALESSRAWARSAIFAMEENSAKEKQQPKLNVVEKISTQIISVRFWFCVFCEPDGRSGARRRCGRPQCHPSFSSRMRWRFLILGRILRPPLFKF